VNNLRIFLDLDGVLADFVGGACRIHGWTRERFAAKHPPGSWFMQSTLQVSNTKFWRHIDEAGVDFWLGLQPTPWARELVRLVEQYTKDWYVLSAPSKHVSSYVGKLGWIRRFFGDDFDRLLLTSHKHLLATPQSLLIDDREKTTEAFVASGGHAIIFPSLHNCFHPYAADPVPYVSRALKEITSMPTQPKQKRKHETRRSVDV